MAKRGKRYIENLKLVDRTKRYSLEEAISILKEMQRKFDETVNVAVKLGIDPKRTDQAVRGAVVLPFGIGREIKVLVFAKGEKAQEAREAGADIVADEQLIREIAEKKEAPNVDIVIATPDMMNELTKIGKILGPKGLMPNPKAGTLTHDVKKAVQDAKKGKVEFRTDRGGCVHIPAGKISWEVEKLVENIETFIKTLNSMKPPTAKGQFISSITVSTTHSPGVKIDVNSIFKKKKK
jgi:large subunit ribosomal protein L1